MSEPKVTIITPSYNCAKWLPETVESVLSQTYGNLELLIVDDGSTDNTREILQPYLSTGKVKYFRQQNAGQATARNFGLKESTGIYVAYLDADDTWEPTKLEKQVSLLQKEDIQVCYTRMQWVDESGGIIEYSPEGALVPRTGWVLQYLFVDNFVPFSSVIVEKKCLDKIGGSNVTIKKSDDWDLLLRLAVFCKFDYVDEKLMNYRVAREGQLSVDSKGRFESVNKIASNFIKNNPEALSSQLIKKAYAYRCGQYANAVFDKNFKESLSYYCRSAWHDPGCLELYKNLARNTVKRVVKNVI